MIQLRPLVGTNALVNFVRQYYDAGPGVFQYFSGQVGAGGVPSMYEDFTTGQALDPRITFSRTSNATLTGSNGLIQYAPHNLLTYSEQFDNAVWTKTAASISANTVLAPNGTTTADKAVENTALSTHGVSQTFTLVAGTTYSISVYAKAAERTCFTIGAGSLVYGFFNLSTGVATPGVGNANNIVISAAASDVGNGWYRCTVAVTRLNTNLTTGPEILLSNTTTPATGSAVTYTGDGASGIYIWGAQLNVDALQSYNPTTVKNLLGYTQEFDNAAWTKSNSFVQTNLLTYSQEVDNAAWTKNSVTSTANATTAPDGSLTADLVDEGTASAQHYFFPAAIAATTGTTYTASVYMKQGTVQWMQIPLNSVVFGVNAWANFDLVNGVVGNVGASATATITPAGNGWFRCAITSTATASSTGTTLQIAFCGNTDTATRLPTTTGANLTVNVWGAQLVQGSSAGNYTATYSAAKAVMYPAPDGSVSADKLVETTATSGHIAFQGSTFISSTPYGFSLYVKAAERTKLRLYNNMVGGFDVSFDVSAGTATSVIGVGSITSVGNGWYRCSVVFTSGTSGSANCQIQILDSSGNSSYTGDGTSGIYIWGAQLSDSASVDPYVYNPVAAPSAAAYYGPRFDYDPITLAPKGLLIEEQRTNLLTYSDQFDNAAWLKTNTVTIANSATSPDGTGNADTLTDDPTNSFHMVGSVGVTFTASTAYAFTTYAKAGTASIFQLSMDATPFSAAAYANFNLSTGAVGAAGAGVTSSMTPVGNGWYRCVMVVTSGAGGGLYRAYIGLTNNQNTASMRPTYVGSGQSVYLWGAQLEVGAFATSYIPTVASQVTRSADIAQMLGANFSNWYNQSAGTMYVETAVEGWNSGNNNTAVAISAGSSGSSVITTLQSYNGTGRPRSLVYNASAVLEADMYPASTVAPNVVCKQALAIALNDYALSKDGAAVIADTSATVPTVDRLVIGAGGAAGGSSIGFINGWVKRIAYYNTRLTNAQLQGITA